jgi:flagellar M-ring protein FliF
MNELLKRYLDQGRNYWVALTRAQQLLIATVGGSLLITFLLAWMWLGRTDYATLFSNLSQEDAAAIVEQLRTAKVPYKLDNGNQVLVPSRQVYDLRLKLSSQGLPSGGGVGFEVFDRSSFGITDFTQKLNYQRALQGELGRTIAQLKAVQQARVHLVIPQPTLFTERERPATASVVLKLRPGGSLTQQEVRAISHLVASSVEGLAPERITVVDTSGRVLSLGNDRGLASLTSTQLETKAAIESDLERRVTTMLEQVLGPGKASVRVAAQLNFDQIERTEERFDPNSVVRQEQRSTESTQGTTTTPVGIPGANSNVNVPVLGGGTTNTRSNRESEVLNYEISKSVERKVVAPGAIARLSVAVMVDGLSRAVSSGAETKEYVPRSAEELEKLRRVVTSAVGFNVARGDEVQLVEMPFDVSTAERERVVEVESAKQNELARRNTIIGVAAGVIVLLLLLAFIKMRRRKALEAVLTEVSYNIPGVGTMSAEAAREAVDEARQLEMLELEGKRKEELRQKALQMAYQKPGEVVQLLRAWMLKRKKSTA